MRTDELREFDIVSVVDGDCARVAVIGELDIATAPKFINTISDLTRDGIRAIEVNCGAVEFLDSAGVRALVVSRNEASKLGAHLAVVEPSPPVRRVLEMTGLAPLLL